MSPEANQNAAPAEVLQSKIRNVLLTVSIVPLVITGIGAWIVFGGLLEKKTFERQSALVQGKAEAIHWYLQERLHLLKLTAETHNLNILKEQIKLNALLNSLNNAAESGFVDLGVIDQSGRHLSYTGPFSLMDKNYAETDWFKEVMHKGVYISDMFLGFRGVPHIILAVKVCTDGYCWIIRATIDSDKLESFVKTDMMGTTGDIYLVNNDGLYQTTPRHGKMLDKSPILNPAHFSGVKTELIRDNGYDKFRVMTWVPTLNWLLVVEQDAREIRAPMIRAITNGAIAAGACMIIIIAAVVIATRLLAKEIDKANRQRQEMYGAFMRSAKLASIGELATGLAHEINNPLAIISADRTNISDIANLLDDNFPDKNDILKSLDRIKRQVERCKSITSKMLLFGRKRESELKAVNIASHLKDVAVMLERQAKVANIELKLKLDDKIPDLTLDPVELEQIMINLITNSIQAMPGGGVIIVEASINNNQASLSVEDNGQGMPKDVLEKIFEPFFTTKPAGQGTGLGLSVCYGIVKSWGGNIKAESSVGKGTKITMTLPLKSA